MALEEGEVRYHSSGTSLKAMSVLLKTINLLIQEEHGGSPGIDKIEKAIRSGKNEILLFGQKVGLKEYLDRESCNDPAVPAQLSGFGIGLRRCFHL